MSTNIQAENPSRYQSSMDIISKANAVNNKDKSKGDFDIIDSLSDFFDNISTVWQKLMHLAKLLRNIIQDYNQKKQIQNWDLQINYLNNRKESIENQYKGDRTRAYGSIFGGLAVAGGSALSAFNSGALFDVEKALGQASDKMISGMTDYVSAGDHRASGIEGAIAELQKQGSDSYNRALNETLESARSSVIKMLETGQQLVTQVDKVYQAFARG